MRAVQIVNDWGVDALQVVEVADAPLGHGQVRIGVRAVSLNFRDLMVASGRYGRGTAPANLVPLSDGAGEVVEIGADVTRVKIGDRVAGMFMQTWQGGEISPEDPASSLGGAIDGVLSEYRVFDQHGLVQLPAHLSFEEGATLPCAGVTAWNALFAGTNEPVVARPIRQERPSDRALVLIVPV